MYVQRLEQLGVDVSKRIHTTCLKERILAQCPGLQEHRDGRDGRDVMLIFNEDVGPVLKKAINTNYDNDAMIISKASKIIRRDLLSMENSVFGGTFKMECQEKSVPQPLLSLVGMIMGGPNIETQSINIVENQSDPTVFFDGEMIQQLYIIPKIVKRHYQFI